MANLEIPFAIGETVWWTGKGSRVEYVTCPDCAGTKIITLVQGNGEKLTLDCACCSFGYEPPSGVLKQTIYEHVPTRFQCNRVDISGGELRYSEASLSATCYNTADAKTLFRTQEECQQACDKLNVEAKKSREQMMLQNLASKRRDMVWSVHYWGRKVKDLEANLERARARLNACHERNHHKQLKSS